MSRYLIVANQTLGGEKLNATVRERIERGDSDFHILVPMTPPHHETESSAGSVAYEGMSADEARQWAEQDNERRAAKIESARSLAEQRLNQMIQTIESAGARAEGTICDANPIDAVKEAAGGGAFDEVIISTLPTRLSRWLKMDVPSRVARVTHTPVTTIEAQE
jgi:nucleotide-binding universal stress UspA family protein